MRIVAGELGGRVLQTPRGRLVRPTAGRVREALFNSLGPLPGAAVLDLFAGSGALGFEAISRGAATCLFADDAAASIACLRANAKALGVESRVTVRRADFKRVLRDEARGGSRFDLSRFGMEAMRASPRQADGMIVAGWCSIKMAPRVVRLYEQIPDPKWVVAMGSCAISGNVWDTYNIVQGIDSLIPVDVYIPGCPPRPEALWQGLEMIRDRIKQSSHAYDGLRRIPARDLLAVSEGHQPCGEKA